jgi:hypothetical protein
MKRLVRKYMVYHSEGADVGFLPRLFTSKRRAKALANKWNRGFPGHVVREVTPNAEAHGQPPAKREVVP